MRIFNHYNLIQFIRATCLRMLFMHNDVDVISVQYLLSTYRESPTTFIKVISQVELMLIHHLTLLVMFLPQS